jgi:hypothetical protein
MAPDPVLHGYSDAAWASQYHRHSISGFVFILNEAAVSWSANKQSVIALSSTEAEYLALSHSTKEAPWYRHLLKSLHMPLSDPITLYCDNQSTITLTANNSFHAKSKHIDICYHSIRKTVESKDIAIKYKPTDAMTADIFTKALPKPKVQLFRSAMGVSAS